MRSKVKVLIRTEANAAPMKAFFVSTPTAIIGGAINIVRRTVQPISATPEPFCFSRTAAEVR